MDKIILGDFYEELPKIRINTVDMILTDLPYNITQNKWETDLDLTRMWDLFNHVIKDNGVIVLTSVQPFTSKIIQCAYDLFKYEYIFVKSRATNHLNSKKQPLRKHESILVFYKEQPTYNIQFNKGLPYDKGNYNCTSSNYGDGEIHRIRNEDGKRYPTSILYYENEKGLLHPTQKPVKLFEYLIKTYTNEGDTVLDCCAGSGTTGVACKNLNRNYILIEKEEKYYDIIKDRLLD